MSIRFFVGLGALAALPITWGLFIQADHAELPFGTPGSNSIKARFSNFNSHAFDSRGVNHRVPLSERYDSGTRGYESEAESQRRQTGSWGQVRDGLRREAPRGPGGAEPAES
ncbi:hypothetical protein B0A50_01948 [Salinomyces thailandicus]|uniref:Secreted protein n=1 Tax=Salinomyces thailandicus TaxID=706561 RepID=A0A4U0U6Y5_9PEZI|nr:hypothetical protein B0A50_01948 [Salinomyces thailandica]